MINLHIAIQGILVQIAAIQKKYEQIVEITGENFNIFRILRIGTKEVNTHSPILHELLNPLGTHGCKDTFLRIFIDLQKKKHKNLDVFLHKLNQFSLEKCEAIRESYIATEGHKGYIDILLKDRNGEAIVIENKINACDRVLQLWKYRSYYPKAPIFYLTLEGESPSTASIGNLTENIDFVCISYAQDIKGWLEACRMQAVNHPLLRETITQYINLIKYLTHQTIIDNMKNEIFDLVMKSPEYIEASVELFKAFGSDDSIYRLVFDRLEVKIAAIADTMDLKYKFDSTSKGFWYYKDEWDKCVNFSFDDSGCWENLYVSIANLKEPSNPLQIVEVTEWSDSSWGQVLDKIPAAIAKYCIEYSAKIEVNVLDISN